jgi:hypothetical protein
VASTLELNLLLGSIALFQFHLNYLYLKYSCRNLDYYKQLRARVKIAEEPDEVKSLLEAGFEYVCQKNSSIFMKKRK